MYPEMEECNRRCIMSCLLIELPTLFLDPVDVVQPSLRVVSESPNVTYLQPGGECRTLLPCHLSRSFECRMISVYFISRSVIQPSLSPLIAGIVVPSPISSTVIL